jgi:hypothetical protein
VEWGVDGVSNDTSASSPLPATVRGSTADPVDGTGTAAPVKFARIFATADGDNTLVAAVTSKKIRVIGYKVQLTGVGTAVFKSGAGTSLADVVADGNAGGASYAGSLLSPAFETAAATALVINNPTGIDTLGHLSYVEV